MKDIRLNFLGLGYLDCFQADIIVYNRCNNIIYEGQTYNGEINLRLKYGEAYRARVRNNCNIINIVFYVGKSDSYTFGFNNNITFKLVDYYYDNLPIERGDLWLRT